MRLCYQAAPDQIGGRSGQESSEEENHPQGIYSIGYQAIEDAFEGQNTSIETSEVDEAFGGLIEAEGPEARNRSRSSTVKLARGFVTVATDFVTFKSRQSATRR
jgi:hypothetical protein